MTVRKSDGFAWAAAGTAVLVAATLMAIGVEPKPNPKDESALVTVPLPEKGETFYYVEKPERWNDKNTNLKRGMVVWKGGVYDPKLIPPHRYHEFFGAGPRNKTSIWWPKCTGIEGSNEACDMEKPHAAK